MSLIRVFWMPPDLRTDRMLFQRPEPAVFQQVDWFQDPDNWMGTPQGQQDMAEFLRRKPWFSDGSAYLVLGETGTFTIGYKA